MKNSSFNTLQVYQKSLVLKDLTTAIAYYFSHDSNFFSNSKSEGLRTEIVKALFVDASLISSNIKEVTVSKSGVVRNKNLIFINIMTRNILSYCNGLEKDGVKEKEYVHLLRREIQIFRSHFKQWRKSLQTSDDN